MLQRDCGVIESVVIVVIIVVVAFVAPPQGYLGIVIS